MLFSVVCLICCIFYAPDLYDMKETLVPSCCIRNLEIKKKKIINLKQKEKFSSKRFFFFAQMQNQNEKSFRVTLVLRHSKKWDGLPVSGTSGSFPIRGKMKS